MLALLQQTIHLHSPPEFDENGFHSELSLPLHQAGQLGWINLCTCSADVIIFLYSSI